MAMTHRSGPVDRPADRIEIDARYAADRWPYVCPRGHIDWRPEPDGFVCLACQAFGYPAPFDALIHRRSSKRIPRERVLITRTATAAAYEVE